MSRGFRWPFLAVAAACFGACAPASPQVQILAPANVTVSRVISANIPAKPLDCAIEPLAAMPAQGYREVGTIEVMGGGLSRENTIALIDQRACEMGADAIVMARPVAAGTQTGPVSATAIVYTSSLANGTVGPPPATSSPSPELPEAREQSMEPQEQQSQSESGPPATP